MRPGRDGPKLTLGCLGLVAVLAALTWAAVDGSEPTRSIALMLLGIGVILVSRELGEVLVHVAPQSTRGWMKALAQIGLIAFGAMLVLSSLAGWL